MQRHWIGWALIGALLAALYGRVVWDMGLAWANEMGASHGFMIPPLVAWIVWTGRERIVMAQARPDAAGLWLLPIAAALYLVGRLGAEFFLTRLSLIVNGAALIWIFWGRARLWALKFPILLLATMIPIPQLVYKALSGPLQRLASTLATQIAQAAGVAVFQDGNIIHLAGTSLGVEEACSGMQSIVALVIGSLLLGFLQLRSAWLRGVLLVSAFPIAIVANVIRVSGTAILADHWQEAAMGFYHYFSGWVVFMAAFGLLLASAAALRKLEATFA